MLIVEDHPAVAGLLAHLIEGAFPDVVLRRVESAEEALLACQHAMPRLVVMDVGLPGMNGIDATKQIKSLSATVRIIVHSNFDDAVYREGALAAGADAFISKSRTHAELVPKIAELLSVPRNTPNAHSPA